ncbi:helix-turn-helix transcriptional regulator [Zoogloea sp.]|uniref:helix-turn-helix domain-containing protein n=1 Tax=Zoogloea sp. TaxID=49181 RepID=UPI0035B28943
MTTLASRKKPATNGLRHQQAELVKTIGARLKESRELCNMSLSESARQLGYANPSKLSKVENATDTRSVPFWLIPAAAKLYDVSTEYLYSLSDDWQTGCWRGITPYMQKTWDQQRARDFKALATVNQRVTAALEVLPALAEAADYTLGAIKVLEEKNRNFNDMPGGARLQAAARRLQAAAAEALKAQRHLQAQLPPELAEEAQNA